MSQTIGQNSNHCIISYTKSLYKRALWVNGTDCNSIYQRDKYYYTKVSDISLKDTIAFILNDKYIKNHCSSGIKKA